MAIDLVHLLTLTVMRLDKSFRVILNSPVFPQMTVERAGDRSVRFGAQDETHLRVFLIKVRHLALPTCATSMV